VSALAHLDALDERYARPVDPTQQDVDAIAEELRRRGAPETCYVLSANPTIDGRFMPLSEVLTVVVGHEFDNSVSCLVGRLA
jgi:hypothetical protein